MMRWLYIAVICVFAVAVIVFAAETCSSSPCPSWALARGCRSRFWLQASMCWAW